MFFLELRNAATGDTLRSAGTGMGKTAAQGWSGWDGFPRICIDPKKSMLWSCNLATFGVYYLRFYSMGWL
jgi:hypothetical protein